MSNWYQIYITTERHDELKIMSDADEIVQKVGAMFVAPNGVPLRGDDGTYEVRAFSDMAFKWSQRILKNQFGFEIVRTVTHES